MEEKSSFIVEDRPLSTQRGMVSVVSFSQFSMLDRSEIDKMGADLLALIEEKDRKRVLINFEGVDYLSSTVLGKLIVLHKRMAEKQGQLKLCGIKPSIREVFEMTRLDKVFEIYADESEGMQAFERSA